MSWAIGDKIGAVSQTQEPRVLMRWGEVVEVHPGGLTVRWPGEKSLVRYDFTARGMSIERRGAGQ